MLKIIAAVATNGVIGRDNTLPWHLQGDLGRFKQITTGHTVVMGSNTFRSILDRLNGPLPNRINLVLTRKAADADSKRHDGFDFITWWQSIVHRATREDIFVIGGAKLYEQLLPYAEELFLTRVHADVTGDVLFPVWNQDEWIKFFSELHARDSNNEYDFTFEIYRRISGLRYL